MQQEIAELERRKLDLATAFEESAERAEEIWKALTDLDKRGDSLNNEEFEEAKNALRNGNYSLADALFHSVVLSGNQEQKSIAAYGRGLIAEEEALWPDAAEHFSVAAEFSENQDTLSKAAYFALLTGQPMEAYEFAARLRDYASTNFGEFSKELSDASLILADVLMSLGRFDEAQSALKDAMRIAERIYEEDSTELGNVFFSAARYLERTGFPDVNVDRLALALAYFQRAYDIFSAQGEDGKEDLATVGLSYGAFLATVRQFDAASELIDDAIATRSEKYGVDHPLYATALSYRVKALFAQERYAEALVDTDAMSKIELGHGLMSRYADTLSTVARIKWNLGEDNEALSFFERSLLLQRELSGRDSDAYSGDLKDFGQFLTGRNFARAVPVYEELAEIYRVRYGSDSLEYMLALTSLSHSYHCSGESQSAVETAKTLQALVSEKYDPSDQNVVSVARILDLAEQGDASIEECQTTGPLSSNN